MADVGGTGKQPEKAWKFERRLSPGFVTALKELAKKPSWFRDVLADDKLIICVRDNYINVYVDGQSLFRAEWKPGAKSSGSTGTTSVSTHPKYLLDPALSSQVPLVDGIFMLGESKPIVDEFEVGKTLTGMKTAARLYSGVEKKGVHKIALAAANPDVVDLEIALSAAADHEPPEGSADDDGGGAKATAKRVDIACLQEIDGKVELCFWEAKHYSNAELWAAGDTLPPVVAQVAGYRSLIKQYDGDIAASYVNVAENLVSLASMAGREDRLGRLIREVAAGQKPVVVGTPAKVGIVVYGFSAAEKASQRHKSMLDKLRGSGIVVVAKGSAAGLGLRWDDKLLGAAAA